MNYQAKFKAAEIMCTSNSFILLLIALIHYYFATTIVISQESCNECSCQFNNIQGLDPYIEAKINSALSGKFVLIDTDYHKCMDGLAESIDTRNSYNYVILTTPSIYK